MHCQSHTFRQFLSFYKVESIDLGFNCVKGFLIGLFRSTSGYINQLGFCYVLFLTYYSVECQTKSLSNLRVRFAMFPIFLAINRLLYFQVFLLLTDLIVI